MGAFSYQADDGVRVAYHDWNAGAGGPPIVLQHGFATSSVRNWFLTGIVEALARGRRVIAIDARGHGESASLAIPRSMEVCVWHAISAACSTC